MDYSKKINVIYEDNHLLVVEKPINVPVQEDSSKDMDLLTLLKAYLKEKYNKQGNVYLGLVHRLDRPVGGIMVFAKTSKAAGRISEEIRRGNFNKKYLAIVEGNIEKSGTFVDSLLKDKEKNIVKVDKEGKESILKYQVIKTIDNLNLVEVDLITGRSHQIRVQFSSRGYPLFGDHKYNKNPKSKTIALHSKSIEFKHPVKDEIVKFELEPINKKPFDIFY